MAGKILIVDDQFGIRILLNEVLQKEGIRHFKQRMDSRLRNVQKSIHQILYY